MEGATTDQIKPHPAFALAVHAAMHNTATWKSWDIIDNEYPSPEAALVAVGRIYGTNGWPWTDKEQGWWSAELAPPIGHGSGGRWRPSPGSWTPASARSSGFPHS